jgi:hypothetical protein
MVQGVLTACSFSARLALFPALVPAGWVNSAIGLDTGLTGLSITGAPAIAGMLLVQAGITQTFATVAVVLVVASFAATPLLALPDPSSRTAAVTVKAGSSLIEGELRPWDRTIWPLFALISVLGLLAYRSLMPTLARDVLAVGPVGLGVMTTAAAWGIVLGGLAAIILGLLHRIRAVFLLVVALVALAYAAFGLSGTFAVAAFLAVGLGALSTAAEALAKSLVVLVVPDPFRGRLAGAYLACSALSGGLGAVPFMMSGAMGLKAASVGTALLCLGAVGAIWLGVPEFAASRETDPIERLAVAEAGTE